MDRQQPHECRESWEFIRQRSHSNPATDNSVKDLALHFDKFGPQKFNEEIINHNIEWLNVFFDITRSINNGGTHEDLSTGIKQEIYKANLYVDKQSGKIIDIDYDDEIDLLQLYGNKVAKLELQVLIDYEEFNSPHPNYQNYKFSICGFENPDTGRPQPLSEILSQRATWIIEDTQQVCNYPIV